MVAIRPEWMVIDREKRGGKSIVMLKQTKPPFLFKVIVWNYESKFEKDFEFYTDASDFVAFALNRKFHKGNFYTRRDLSAKVGFSRNPYPEWFRKRVVNEVVDKGQSTGKVAKKYGISFLTIIKYLHEHGYFWKGKGGSSRYGVWIKTTKKEYLEYRRQQLKERIRILSEGVINEGQKTNKADIEAH